MLYKGVLLMTIKSFRELTEAKGDTAVFTFGRFNPPTTGHEKLIDACAKQQKKNSGSKMYVYASQSNDPKKNPLPYAKKIAYMRKMFKKYARNIITGKPRTAIEVAVELHNKGHRAIVMVVGSDRVEEFDKLLNDYNGVESRHGYYGFDNIEVVSAGERDPDAEGVEGMSASKMRVAAADGDFESFSQGLPKGFKDAKKIYRDVRAGMGMREEREMGDMNNYEEMRDAYLTGKIWNVGENVIVKGKEGEVVRKGTNYLSYMTEDGKVHKAWLHEVSALDRLKKFDKSRTAAGKKPIFKDKGDNKFIRMKKKGMMTTMNVPSDEVNKYKKKGYEIIESSELDERNYKKEYDNYQGKPEQIARRSSRNKARRVMGDKTKIGMDVGHKDNNPLNNDPKNLKNEDPTKNRREPRLREEEEIDEMTSALPWLNKAVAKMHQITHPTAYKKLVKRYMDGMKDKKHREHPAQWASDIAREYRGVEGRDFIRYINKLVDKGDLPKELKAEYVEEKKVFTFKEFVNTINNKEELNEWGEIEESAEYQGRKVTLNKPTSGDVKKSKVYVKNEKGNVVKVNFGDPNMEIKADNPARRKSFRARHNCENPGPKWKARYWSCKAW